ncbi:hypothetical protein VTL71DRAFT_9602 [Oculimacula yallundae]|uniref:Zn(2)-C6 fungal-type domain-containing protein n=1 Tax=Oculimacula yallundae TaxID=86028 RepID=A0ABR4BRA2_9HELO
MVNNGVSGACEACKQRHKKCDESRPSCLRCSKARRVCPGYNTKKNMKFVNYSGEVDWNTSVQSLPVNTVSPSESSENETLDWEHIEDQARIDFYKDYCIYSPNQDISRGYLSGLPALTRNAGPTSDVAKACTTIALASLGLKSRDQKISKRAQNLHTSLLRSFSLSISTGDTFISVESLITATLLGLHEKQIIINVDTDSYNGAHIAHAQGVSAILTSKTSPFNLVCGGKLFKAATTSHQSSGPDHEAEIQRLPNWQHTPPDPNKVASRLSILCTPLSRHGAVPIDEIFARTEPLYNRAMSLLARDSTLDELSCVKRDAENLKDEYNLWQASLPEEWVPREVRVLKPRGVESSTPKVGYWPGPVDIYHDPYIATIWNAYRKARLLVINIIMSCYNRICTFPEHEEINPAIYTEIAELSAGIISSIPFVLSADVHAFLESIDNHSPVIPGKPVGGLLVMHTLYVISVLPIINPQVQRYLRDCLTWIGEHMKIGQAVILSKCATNDLFEYVTEAHGNTDPEFLL